MGGVYDSLKRSLRVWKFNSTMIVLYLGFAQNWFFQTEARRSIVDNIQTRFLINTFFFFFFLLKN